MQIAIVANSGSFNAITVGLVILIGATIILHGLASRAENPSRIYSAIVIAAALCFLILAFRLATDKTLIADEVTWHRLGAGIADYLKSGIDPPKLNSGKEGYAWIVGVLYAAAGPAPLVPIVLGIVCFLALVPINALIAGYVVRDMQISDLAVSRAQTAAAFLTSTAATVMVWVPRMLRESLIMALISLIALLLIKLFWRASLRSIVLLCISLAALTWTRAQIGIGVAGAILSALIIVRTLNFKSNITRVAIIAPTLALLISGVWVYVDSERDLSLENTLYLNQSLSDATSSFGANSDSVNVNNYAALLSVNLPRAIAGPFPQELTLSGVMLLALVSNVVWIFYWSLCFLAFRRLRKAHTPLPNKAWRSALILLVIAAALVVIISINTGNYGLLIRMRLMPTAVLLPLAGVGYSVLRDIRSNKRSRYHIKGTSHLRV